MPYPKQLPIESVRRIIAILRKGDPEYPQLVLDSYELLGYLLSVTIGDPDEPQVSYAGEVPIPVQCVGEISELNELLGGDPIPLGGLSDILVTAIATKLLELLLEKIEEWTDEANNGG